jgi:hypothetical protein
VSGVRGEPRKFVANGFQRHCSNSQKQIGQFQASVSHHVAARQQCLAETNEIMIPVERRSGACEPWLRGSRPPSAAIVPINVPAPIISRTAHTGGPNLASPQPIFEAFLKGLAAAAGHLLATLAISTPSTGRTKIVQAALEGWRGTLYAAGPPPVGIPSRTRTRHTVALERPHYQRCFPKARHDVATTPPCLGVMRDITK